MNNMKMFEKIIKYVEEKYPGETRDKNLLIKVSTNDFNKFKEEVLQSLTEALEQKEEENTDVISSFVNEEGELIEITEDNLEEHQDKVEMGYIDVEEDESLEDGKYIIEEV